MLAPVLLGPWAGAVVIAAVLIVQCFLFQDGGVTALGANFVNMGLIGAVGGYADLCAVARAIGGRRGDRSSPRWRRLVLGAAGLGGVRRRTGGLGASRADFFRVLSWMALVHSLIGLGEALITGIVVRSVMLRPARHAR